MHPALHRISLQVWSESGLSETLCQFHVSWPSIARFVPVHPSTGPPKWTVPRSRTYSHETNGSWSVAQSHRWIQNPPDPSIDSTLVDGCVCPENGWRKCDLWSRLCPNWIEPHAWRLFSRGFGPNLELLAADVCKGSQDDPVYNLQSKRTTRPIPASLWQRGEKWGGQTNQTVQK